MTVSMEMSVSRPSKLIVALGKLTKVKSNCIVYAMSCWFKSGGYIVLRKSNFGWWPHMVWTKDFATFQEFTPLAHQEQMTFPPLFFKGLVKITSREDQIACARVRSMPTECWSPQN